MNRNGNFRSVLIFGGAGFIGCNWANWLLENSKARVHVFDNLSRSGVRQNLDWLQKSAGHSGKLQITVGDVRNAALVEKAVRPATEIYHFAAQAAVTDSIADPYMDFDVNARGTLNILEGARKSGRKPFLLFTSTNKVYGNLSGHPVRKSATRYEFADDQAISESQPLDFYSPYGCSKGAADQYVRDYCRIYQIPTVVFRMSCIAGRRQFGNEDQGWLAHFLYSALQNRPLVIYGDGFQVRDVLCIDDLLRAFELVHERQSQTAGEVFNIGGGIANATSLVEVIAQMQEITGKKLKYSQTATRPGDQPIYVTDHTKISNDTGWKPEISLPETMTQIVQWYRRNSELLGHAAAKIVAAPPLNLVESPEAA